MAIVKRDFELPGDNRNISVRLAEVFDFLSMHCGDRQMHMMRSVDAAANRIESQAARIAELEAVVERVSKTAPRHLECNDFHHEKKDRHKDHGCPVLKRWVDAIEAAEAARRAEQ